MRDGILRVDGYRFEEKMNRFRGAIQFQQQSTQVYERPGDTLKRRLLCGDRCAESAFRLFGLPKPW